MSQFACLQNGSRISPNLFHESVNTKIMVIMEEGIYTKKKKAFSGCLIFRTSLECCLGDVIKSLRNILKNYIFLTCIYQLALE